MKKNCSCYIRKRDFLKNYFFFFILYETYCSWQLPNDWSETLWLYKFHDIDTFWQKIRMHNKFLKLNNNFCSLGIIDWFQGLIFRSFTGTFCFQGPPNNHGNCETCYGKFRECPGHFGYLILTLPVYHAGYLANVVNILKCICKVIDLSLIFLNSLFQTSSFLQMLSYFFLALM